MSSARVITSGRIYQLNKESEECSKMQNKYDSRQLNRFERRQNEIEAIEVLKVSKEFLEIPLPKAFGENRTTKIPMGNTESYKKGQYIDVTLIYTVTGGEAHSFSLKFWGSTPTKFVPQNKNDGRRN